MRRQIEKKKEKNKENITKVEDKGEHGDIYVVVISK